MQNPIQIMENCEIKIIIMLPKLICKSTSNLKTAAMHPIKIPDNDAIPHIIISDKRIILLETGRVF